MPAMSDIAEILLAQIWNGQWFHQPLRTSCGSEIRVVYPGVWTHGFGPDFTGAMLEISGKLVTGDVEIDLSVSGWFEHEHHRNESFDSVVLHIVARDDGSESVRTSSGKIVPQVALLNHLRGPLEEFSQTQGLRPLGAIGFDTCAPGPAFECPEMILDACERAGDRRMQERVSAMSGELACQPPAQVLYTRLLDALGFSRNRQPMAEVAARLPYEQLESHLTGHRSAERFWRAAALLLGTGGFLPLSPRDAAVGELTPDQLQRIETRWLTVGEPWHGVAVAPSFWTLARSRPAAHPVRRLLAMAVLLARRSESIVETLTSRAGESADVSGVRDWFISDNPYLGRDHAHEVIINVIVPFLIAYGETAAQPEIVDAGAKLWQELPAGRGNSITRKTLRQICGDSDVKAGSARAEQGLIHINRNGCSQMRCYECPIAHLALQWEPQVR
jgi:hypothetical protein